ncbi:hypothetical protein PAHAL_6G117500 [Panicum hallii]|uniref:non-specific serine/threonine protein kinase n=1 Tax=Panicum hallii TaxID=206008 RepID=A0A2T8IG09_9POAL|nr:hypothetical protein PAHAL_6G117500 [Panicum hallii]
MFKHNSGVVQPDSPNIRTKGRTFPTCLSHRSRVCAFCLRSSPRAASPRSPSPSRRSAQPPPPEVRPAERRSSLPAATQAALLPARGEGATPGCSNPHFALPSAWICPLAPPPRSRSPKVEGRNKEGHARTEREILEAVDHPFLPRLYGVAKEDRWSCLLTEFCPGGDLHVLRQRQPHRRFSEATVRYDPSVCFPASCWMHPLPPKK